MPDFDFSPIALLATLLAVLMHGGGHLLAARLVGVRFLKVCQTSTGFRLLTDRNGFPSYRAEAFVALGGPLANAVGALVLPSMLSFFATGETFVELFSPFSFYLCFLNLLPVRGFDGGTLLFCLLCRQKRFFPCLLPHTAERIVSCLSALVLFLLWLMAVYLLLRHGSALSLYLFCFQLFRTVFVENRERDPSS